MEGSGLAYALIRPNSNLNCKNMVHIHRQSRPLDHNMHTTFTGPQKSEKMPIVIILIFYDFMIDRNFLFFDKISASIIIQRSLT